ncbi:MAG TPA: Zn-ribbon domain-containing OB-fold protein [Blastocatellia bacterium]|nr:Zn-ribbon domain-containing OB-fold protein [Blastocatellia bacterium]
MILEGNITIPYKWTTGPTVGRFLAELKENGRVVGARCGGCGKVYVPPADVCGECYKPLDDWVALSGEGSVVALTTVERVMPFSPAAAPYTLALVRLDGADTDLLHLASPGLRAGDRVAAVFKSERTGSLLDIECFAALGGAATPHAPSQESGTGSNETEPSMGTELSTEGTPTPMGMVYEVSDVFQALPTRLHKELVEENLTFYFSIDGEQWTVLVTQETCDVQPGKTVENADCFLKTTKEIFLGTINGTYTPSMTDLIMGRVKTNNPFLLQKFRELFA